MEKRMTLRPPTITLAVVSDMYFDNGHSINLPALFELRAAGWSVDIELSEPDWGLDAPAVYFTARKTFPDNSPGISTDDKLQHEVFEGVNSFGDRWDGVVDHINFFKNPKAAAWKFHPWNDWPEWSDFWKNYDRA
jgi:hypothetical protein